MDMRETTNGNPTVAEDYSDSPKPLYRVSWVDEDRIRVWRLDDMKPLYTGKLDSGIRNLIDSLGAEIPENPYVLPETVISFYEVREATDEYRSKVAGRFWNVDDAEEFAADHRGWCGSKSSVHLVHLGIKGEKK